MARAAAHRRAAAPVPADRRPDRDADRQRRISRGLAPACRARARGAARRVAHVGARGDHLARARRPRRSARRHRHLRLRRTRRRADRGRSSTKAPSPFDLLAARQPDRRRDRRARRAHASRRPDIAALRADDRAHARSDAENFAQRDAADREFHVRIAAATGNGALRAGRRGPVGPAARQAVDAHRGALPHARKMRDGTLDGPRGDRRRARSGAMPTARARRCTAISRASSANSSADGTSSCPGEDARNGVRRTAARANARATAVVTYQGGAFHEDATDPHRRGAGGGRDLPAGGGEGIPLGRRPSGGLPDGDGGQVHERPRSSRRPTASDTIKVFTGNQLGGEKDTIEQTKIGALDFVRINVAPMNNICPETMVPTMPFLFKSKDHMRKVLDGPIGDADPEGLREAGLHRPRVLRLGLALALHDQEAGQVARRRQGHEDPRPAVGPVGLDAAGDGRERHADALRRGLHGAQDRPGRRRREQLAVATTPRATSRSRSTTRSPSTRWRPRCC